MDTRVSKTQANEGPQITSISVANLRESVPLIFLPRAGSRLDNRPARGGKGREKATLNRPHDVLTHLAEPLPVNCDGEIRQGNKTTRSLPPVSTPVRPLIFTRTSSIRTCVVCASKRPPRKHTEGRSYGNAFGTRFRGTRHFVSRISYGTRLASISTITSLNSHGLV